MLNINIIKIIIHYFNYSPISFRNVLKSREPVYQAIWADSIDFDEVLISPVMLQDHMPDKVLAALKKVISYAADDNTSMNSSYNLNPHI